MCSLLKHFFLLCSLLVLAACASPKVQHPQGSTQPLSVSLPEGFTEADRTTVEQRLGTILGSWPQRTRMSVVCRPQAFNPSTTLRGTWSDSISQASENGTSIGSSVGEVVDLLLLRFPLYKVTLGAAGFVTGGLGGTLVGPLIHGFNRAEEWKVRDYNFFAAVRIESAGKDPIEFVCFDKSNYPVAAPPDPVAVAQRQSKRRESLDGLLQSLTLQLRPEVVFKPTFPYLLNPSNAEPLSIQAAGLSTR